MQIFSETLTLPHANTVQMRTNANSSILISVANGFQNHAQTKIYKASLKLFSEALSERT